MTAPGAPAEGDASRGFRMVLDHLETGILAGRYGAGDALPPERELAAELGTSRGAVREAVRALQAQGLVASAAGPRNGSRISTGQGDALGRILRLHLALGAASLPELLETRVALERSTARLAAQHATPADRADLTAQCERMRGAADPDAFNDLDTEFHVRLARASGNRLTADLTVAIRYAARSPILAAERALPDWDGFRDTLVAQHAELCAVIVAGDAARADALMDAHIRASYTGLQG